MTDHTDPDALLGKLERMVAMAMARGADQAEVFWSREVGLDLDIENNAVAATGRARSEGGGIRVIKDKRTGFAYLTRDDQTEQTIDQALKMSRLAPQKDMVLPSPQPMPTLGNRWDPEIAALDASSALAIARRLLDVRNDELGEIQLAGGGVQAGWTVEGIANSEGINVADRSTGMGVGVNLVMEAGETALNVWDSQTINRGKLDPEGLLRRVARDLRSLRDPAPGIVGEADILFRPDAVTELINGLVVGAIDGDDAMRGKTVWSERLGEQVADSRLSILDDPLRARAIGVAPFDGDGLPCQTLPLIKDGVLANFIFDTRDGAEHGKPSTHSAVRGSFKSPPGVGVHHLVVEGQGAMSTSKLVAGMDSGYVIESVLGAHTANATTGDFSVSAPNAWRVEKGEIVGAAKEIAISGNLPDLLQRLDGIGNQPKAMDGALVPMLRFRGMQVSA